MGKKIFGIDIKDLVFLGKGVEGKVFQTPDGNALKVYTHTSLCGREYKVLKALEGNQYVPKVIQCSGRFMLREYVGGTPIKEYIQQNGLSRRLAINLIEFAEIFEALNLRLDGLSKHVFIQEDESIRAIDPRKRKASIHKSLLGTLKKIEALEAFLKILEEVRPDLKSKWNETISRLTKPKKISK
ncbi:MAG: protein kinase [Bacillota bacterium]